MLGPHCEGILIVNPLTTCSQWLRRCFNTSERFLLVKSAVMARCFGTSIARLVFWQLVASFLSLGMAEFNYLPDYLYPPAEYASGSGTTCTLPQTSAVSSNMWSVPTSTGPNAPQSRWSRLSRWDGRWRGRDNHGGSHWVQGERHAAAATTALERVEGLVSRLVNWSSTRCLLPSSLNRQSAQCRGA